MVRKGWTKVEVPDGWVKILRGPRPPSVRWPKARPAENKSRTPVDSRRCDPKKIATPPPSGQPLPRRTPAANRDAAQGKIARIKASIAALGDEDPEEVEVLKKALEKENQAKVPPVETQILHAEQFIRRAKKRLEGADEKIRRAAEALRQAEHEKSADIQEIADAEAEVLRLRALTGRAQAPNPPQDNLSEVQQLREQVTQLMAQIDSLRANPSNRSEGPVTKRICRQEEFVPHCDEEMQEWMEGRQRDF